MDRHRGLGLLRRGGDRVRARDGVIDTPELLAADEGEYWIFPLVGNVGAFSLSQAAFLDASWSGDGVRLRIDLAAADLEIELA